MSLAILIVAAGRGTRAGTERPKQWHPLAGARVIDHTLALFKDLPGLGPICVVHHPDDTDPLPDHVITAIGGATRDASVRAGLAALAPFIPSLYARYCLIKLNITDQYLTAQSLLFYSILQHLLIQ